jgi:D-lyxose ketol-isomerase
VKRSEVNDILARGADFFRSFKFELPPFAELSPNDMRQRRAELNTVIDCGLGWDVTDYAGGRFEEFGLLLFTLRNGNACDLSKGRGMLYAEKIMISRKDQLTPMHRHAIKSEDIINRGGGRLVVELYSSKDNGTIDLDAPVMVPSDGLAKTLEPGGHLVLHPGESVTLLPGIWHAFWAEGSDALIGEVSTVNDDLTDNYFIDPIDRFTAIEDDAEPCRLLVSDYSEWLR